MHWNNFHKIVLWEIQHLTKRLKIAIIFFIRYCYYIGKSSYFFFLETHTDIFRGEMSWCPTYFKYFRSKTWENTTYLLSLSDALVGVYYFSPLLFCMFENVHNLQSENLYYLLNTFYVPDSYAWYWISIISKFHSNPARTIKPSSCKDGRTKAQGHPVSWRQSPSLNLHVFNAILTPYIFVMSAVSCSEQRSLHSLC